MNKHLPVLKPLGKTPPRLLGGVPTYQPDRYSPKPRQKSSLRYMLLGLVALIAWASFFEIDEAVRGSGKVISDNRTQLIQTVDGGVLSKLLVREGQEVVTGQVVAELERSRANAAYQETRGKLAAQETALIRAQAETLGKPPNYAAFGDYPDLVQVQRGLYEQRKSALDDELRVLKQSLQIAQQELTISRTLRDSGDVPMLDVIRTEKQVLELEGRVIAARNKYLQEARIEAARLQELLASERQKLTERKDVLEHTDLLAPGMGIVKALRVNTIGAVLRPGDELMQIAPTDAGLVFEAMVMPADVGGLRLGLPVSLRLDAYDYSIYGMLAGELIYVSPDTLTEQGPDGRAMTYYRAHIRLLKDQPNPRTKGITAQLGMTGTVDIKTGSRSVLRYLVKPIVQGFTGALREK